MKGKIEQLRQPKTSNTKHRTFKAHIAVLFTNIFFAVNYSIIKFISPARIGSYGLNVIRAATCIILFWVLWLFSKTPAGIVKKDWVRFTLCAFTGIAINQMMFIKGLTLTSTIHAVLLMLVTPVVVTLFALWILKEQFTIFKALGLAAGIGGAVFLILQRELSHHATNYLLGDVLIIVNAISYSIYFILVKPLMQRYSPMHVMRWVFTIGFIMMLPFGWQQVTQIEWNLFNMEHWMALSSVCLLGTFLAYIFNAYSLQKLGASVTGTYIYTQPVFVGIIAVIFLGEQITAQKIVAALLIFAGVFFVNIKKKSAASDSRR